GQAVALDVEEARARAQLARHRDAAVLERHRALPREHETHVGPVEHAQIPRAPFEPPPARAAQRQRAARGEAALAAADRQLLDAHAISLEDGGELAVLEIDAVRRHVDANRLAVHGARD